MRTPLDRTTILVSSGDGWPLELARALALGGDPVTVVLLDRGADLARPVHLLADLIRQACDAGALVLVDVAALRRRGIEQTAIAEGIKPTDLSAVGDLLVDATDKVVWL